MVIDEELWTGDCLEPQLCFATNFVTFLAILEGVFLSAKIRAHSSILGLPWWLRQ